MWAEYVTPDNTMAVYKTANGYEVRNQWDAVLDTFDDYDDAMEYINEMLEWNED